MTWRGVPMADFEYIVADLTNGAALTPTGTAAGFNWVAGQSIKYAVKFRQTSSAGTQEDVSPAILNLRAAVGREGAWPESGWFQVRVGGAPMAPSNTTPRLDWNVDAPEMEAALNELVDGPGDFECDQGEGAILVRRRDGGDFRLSVHADGLRPASYAKITGGQKVKPRAAQIVVGELRFVAVERGDAGNGISVEYRAGLEARALAVVVDRQRIIVDLGMEEVVSEGDVVGVQVASTGADVVAALRASVAASAILEVESVAGGGGGAVLGEMARTYLAGGIEGSGYEYAVELVQAPIVFSDWAGSELPPAPTVQKIQSGGMISAGAGLTMKWPTIQALYVPPDFEGQYQLFRAPRLKRSDLLVKEDGLTKIQRVLQDLVSDEGGSVKVTNPSSNVAHIEFLGDLNGWDIENLEVVVYGAPPPSLSFTLNLDNAEVAEMLRERESVTLPFELDATVWVDSRDQSQGTRTIKLWKTTATISRNLLWDSMVTKPPIDWAAKPLPVDYVPFSKTQYLTGQQAAYTAVIGGGAARIFSISHGLGSGDDAGVIAVAVRENVPGGRQLRDDEYELRFTDAGTVEVEFPEAPGENALAVVVIGYGPKSVFTTHTHPIDQIKTVTSEGATGETLRAVLDEINRRIARLEALYRFQGPAALPSGGAKKKVVIPVVGEILPDILLEGDSSGVTIASQVVAAQNPKLGSGNNADKAPPPIAGTEMESKTRELEAEIARLKLEAEAAARAAAEAAKEAAAKVEERVKQEEAEKVTQIFTTMFVKGVYDLDTQNKVMARRYPAMRGAKYPMLLPAIHAAAATGVSAVPAGFASGLYRNAGSGALVLPGGGGRKSQSIAAGGLFGGDGRAYYAVRRSGATNSYHPVEMERDLMRVVVREVAFPEETQLKVSWTVDFEFASASMTAGAGYFMRVEAMPLPDASVPDPTGGNVGAVGAAVLLGSARIALSRDTKEQRRFSLALTKRAERVVEFSEYGRKLIGPGFPEGAFLLTVRLEQWDVDDSTELPAGQVSITMPDTQLIVEQI